MDVDRFGLFKQKMYQDVELKGSFPSLLVQFPVPALRIVIGAHRLPVHRPLLCWKKCGVHPCVFHISKKSRTFSELVSARSFMRWKALPISLPGKNGKENRLLISWCIVERSLFVLMRPKSFIFLSHIGTNGTTFQNGSGEYLSKCLHQTYLVVHTEAINDRNFWENIEYPLLNGYVVLFPTSWHQTVL